MGDIITAEEIADAQRIWGDGIVTIGKAFTDKGDYVKAAENHLDILYAFEAGTVLFKPTKAADTQFRPTREAALSYFVGGNDNYNETMALPSIPGQMSVLIIPRPISTEITRWPWAITFSPRLTVPK